ncbi:35462_t:CDS:2 [Gigaspora margarita]|uniref:35462_t:CDS:1 n=1 Tax=Gigaspora margarita TaxID=4874 RepID=A0ABN7VU66_GIGMA|nr:35462_t:CDS:2 [Gigaspora margarita]
MSSRGVKFNQNLITVFQCFNCHKKFQCKKDDKINKAEQLKHQIEYEDTEQHPFCIRCNLYHYRCNNSKCNKCCKKVRCNAINCINCQEREIPCKWLIPRTQDKFDLLKSSVTYITMRNIVKDLFNNDERISFSPGILLKESSENAKYYVGKHFIRFDVINNSKLKNIKCQEYIQDNGIEYKTLLKKSIQEPKIIPLSYYNSPFSHKKVDKSKVEKERFKATYKEILINEFKGDIRFLELLNLLDRKDYSVQTKGSSVEFSSYVIAFSTNTNIRFVYEFSEDKQLKPKAYQNHNNTSYSVHL